MITSTKTLLAVLVVVVAAGIVYVLRPGPEINLSVPQDTPQVSPIDDTIPYPPNAQKIMDSTPINQDVNVTLKTNQGDVAITLHGKDAPLTVGNFVHLAQTNFYDNTTFHRVIPDFMIQGGDPLSKDPLSRAQHGTGGPGYKFGDEINARKMVRGVIAMANAGPGTNGSQFFIVTGAAFPHLDGHHTVFGEVTSGMDVVDAISKVEHDARDNPVTPVVIQDIVVANAPQAPLKPLE